MFGISFTELVLILVVALVVLGPERLPGMLRTVGLWVHKVRRMTTEVRAQTGIDDLLRQEGFSGGLAEVRSLLRGDARSFLHGSDLIGSNPAPDPYAGHDSFGSNLLPIDISRERPVEGPDSYGAVPEDLIDEEALARAEQQSPALLCAPASVPDAGDTTSSSQTEASDALGQPNPDPIRTDELHTADDSSRKPGGADE